MHAILGQATIDPARVSEAEAILNEKILPDVKALPGFISGTWTRSSDDTTGRSMVLFDTEANAQAAVKAAEGMQPPAGAPLKIDKLEVFQVVAQI